MPVTRLPLTINTEQRNATQDKDSLLVNSFIDKSESGVVYVTKRPGFAVGAEGITTGLNRGIFYNPYDNEYYYIDLDNLPEPFIPAQITEVDWRPVGSYVPTSMELTTSLDIQNTPVMLNINNSWIQLVQVIDGREGGSLGSLTLYSRLGNISNNTPWIENGSAVLPYSDPEFDPILYGFWLTNFANFGDVITATGTDGSNTLGGFISTDGINWTQHGYFEDPPGTPTVPSGFSGVSLQGAGSECAIKNHNAFIFNDQYYYIYIDVTTDDDMTMGIVLDTLPQNPGTWVFLPYWSSFGFPSGRTVYSCCKFENIIVVYMEGAAANTTDVYTSSDFTSFTYRATIPARGSRRSNSVELGGSLYYSIRPSQTEERQVYKSSGLLTSWTKLDTENPRGYVLTNVGSTLYSVLPRGIEGDPPVCVVDTYRYSES
jgi:hypothetical protein